MNRKDSFVQIRSVPAYNLWIGSVSGIVERKTEEERIMDSYSTVYTAGTGEIVEKKSRFIAQIFPVSSEEEAFSYLEAVKKEYWDARHHCWAYIIGRNPASERMSDDGEPAGTAGKPILEVLRGKGLTDVFAVVTRYFGGTLLGTGGLVRAYSGAVSEGLAHTEIITRIRGIKLMINTDYTGVGKIQYLLGQKKITVLDSVYTDKVTFFVLVPEDGEENLKKELLEATCGQVFMEAQSRCWFARTKEGIQLWEEEKKG